MSVADRVYARALFEAALDEGRLEPVREQLTQVVAAEREIPELRELKQAIVLMQPTQKPPKKVRDYHLRQWYVLADLLDRAGDTMGATRWFREVLAHDAEFADAHERLRALGR